MPPRPLICTTTPAHPYRHARSSLTHWSAGGDQGQCHNGDAASYVSHARTGNDLPPTNREPPNTVRTCRPPSTPTHANCSLTAPFPSDLLRTPAISVRPCHRPLRAARLRAHTLSIRPCVPASFGVSWLLPRVPPRCPPFSASAHAFRPPCTCSLTCASGLRPSRLPSRVPAPFARPAPLRASRPRSRPPALTDASRPPPTCHRRPMDVYQRDRRAPRPPRVEGRSCSAKRWCEIHESHRGWPAATERDERLSRNGKMDIDQPPSPTFHTKYHRPDFTLFDVDNLSAKQRGKLSMNQEEWQRQQACSLKLSVAALACTWFN